MPAAGEGRRMSHVELAVLAAGSGLGSVVFGISGFAFALTASVIWLQWLPPAEVVPLAVICPIVLNVVTLPRVWRNVSWRALTPLALGATVGVPLGVYAVARLEPQHLRLAIGVVLIGYSAFALVRTRLPVLRLPGRVAPLADGSAGLVGGVLGGIAGLSAVLPSLWIGMRGYGRDTQRALLQSYGFYSQGLTLVVFGGIVGLAPHTGRALLVCLPIAIAGSLVGLRLFNRLSHDGFRRAVLAIVLSGGIGLVARGFA
jgi:uncharacterized membrane protein YfcA